MPNNPEQLFNFELAGVLRTKNPAWNENEHALVAEGVGSLQDGGQPDILIQASDGAPVVVETEYVPANTVEKDAKSRLGKTINATGKLIEFVIALRAPKALKSTSQTTLKQKVAGADYEYCLFSRGRSPEDKTLRWPAAGWITGSVDDLATFIENAFLSESVIDESLRVLEDGVKAAAGHLLRGTDARPAVNEKIAAELHQEDCEQTSHMAMAIVANALIFHGIIAGAHAVQTVAELRTDSGALPKQAVLDEWQHILSNINYWPIFNIARRVMLPVPSQTAASVLRTLAGVADKLAALGATQSHDLSGRMFQRLIADRKFLATFYTLPESAALLAELAVSRLDVDWSQPEQVKSLRIADFACGTGTLLAAAYHSVLARYRRAGGNDARIHKHMIEHSLIATDIMPAAAHLAISMLSSTHPTITFEATQVHVLPYGSSPPPEGSGVALGALDILSSEHATDLFLGSGIQTLHGQQGGASKFELKHNSCDLVIMNPPFTRPTNHESTRVPVPSFAGFNTSQDEQRAMSDKLSDLYKSFPDRVGWGNAGLASNFFDLAERKLKPGGILALVMPASLIQGEAWSKTRSLLNRRYDDITMVSLATTGVTQRAFSADTGMAEVLIVGKRRPAKEIARDTPARLVSLLNRPRSAAEAITTARQIIDAKTEIQIGEEHIGIVIEATIQDGGALGIRERELADFCWALCDSKLKLPGASAEYSIFTTPLGEIAARGLVDRDINGGNGRGPFDIKKISGVPTYPCLWRHSAESERSLVVQPDTQGNIRTGMSKKSHAVWKTASRLHLNRDFQLTSQSLAACITPKPSLGGRAWPNFCPHNSTHDEILALWANTTPGIILFWWIGSRSQQGRIIVTISRLPELTVLDPRALSAAQHKKAKAIFTRFKTKNFLPANEAYRDATRKALDRAVLVELLGLPASILESLDLLRHKWCHEPSVHGGKSTKPGYEDNGENT